MTKRKTQRKSKKRRTSTKRRSAQGGLSRSRILLGFLLLLGVVGVIAFSLSKQTQPDRQDSATGTESATATATKYNTRIGDVTSCRRNPDFSKTLGFASVGIDTSGNHGKGVALFDIAATNSSSSASTYQHETWDNAGDIGSFALDKQGNLYIGPSPQVDLLENPPEEQNRLYRIDTATGVMEPFVDLLAARPVSTSNPFGIAGMAYDCETHSLYVSSLAGSTRKEELGRIFQIDLADGVVVEQLEDVDAFGIGIFNGVNGKRLYFGHARSTEVYSIALDETGAFVGEPRVEFSLAEEYPADTLIARRITLREQSMKIDGLKFRYNLVPLAEQGPRPSFRYTYDAEADEWRFVEVKRDDY